jgi:cytochrome b561
MNHCRHHSSIRVLHWAVAGMVIAALVMSTFVMSKIPDSDPEKMAAALRHMAVGLLICAASVVRLFVRRKVTRPPSLSSGMAWADWLAGVVHRVLDVLVWVMIASGVAMAVISKLPILALTGGAFPSELNTMLAHTVHVAGATAIAGILVMHIGGALFHQFILRDGLITRMAFDPRAFFNRHPRTAQCGAGMGCRQCGATKAEAGKA